MRVWRLVEKQLIMQTKRLEKSMMMILCRMKNKWNVKKILNLIPMKKVLWIEMETLTNLRM